MQNNEEIAKSIPRTKEELEEIRIGLTQAETKKTIDKAHATNDKIQRARKMVKMFDTEEFQWFWEMIHDKMEELTNYSVREIKGESTQSRYDPLGQLVQLNTIQGGLEMLDSQSIQKKIIEETAKGELIKVEELEAKLQEINNSK